MEETERFEYEKEEAQYEQALNDEGQALAEIEADMAFETNVTQREG